nr:MAG TPA: hypothetical protein [Caudoviricetes sp.]
MTDAPQCPQSPRGSRQRDRNPCHAGSRSHSRYVRFGRRATMAG